VLHEAQLQGRLWRRIGLQTERSAKGHRRVGEQPHIMTAIVPVHEPLPKPPVKSGIARLELNRRMEKVGHLLRRPIVTSVSAFGVVQLGTQACAFCGRLRVSGRLG
jgi:hypothetical protein